ncbi:hypothetical protein QJS04_geneDACA020281 [Acorus gramineus]|uniref:Late embryogenesis abundant protein LEA-2 subgroup domain-containing protein n=1 Tax=Acorus gramineus TaxID=55184 RepID=A0AAV9AD58_ACOGR|nr:hypothetical protein QJS04_geneDACA020281 [Acorus gramineus]
MEEHPKESYNTASQHPKMSDLEKKRTTTAYIHGDTTRFICGIIIAIIILAGLAALILWLIYRPSKPKFTVVSAAVYDLNNATSPSPSPPAISTTFQFTITVRNPSRRSSIRYDRLLGYMLYHNQAITPPSPLPPMYQEEDSTVAISPILGGDQFVPISSDLASGFSVDEAYGVVPLRVVLMGRIKYKSGVFRSGWFSMYVRCDVLVGLKKGLVGQLPLLLSPACNIDV